MTHPSNLRAGDHGVDVSVLQQRLTRAGFVTAPTGWYDNATTASVRAFQRARGMVVDGIAGPRTRDALVGIASPKALTQADIEHAAAELSVEPAAIHAVVEVEAPRGGFLHDGRVVILFERHVFWQRLLTWDIDPASVHAPESILSQHRGGYVGGVGEYQRLTAAMQIAAEPAVESASWGRFQIMGENALHAGYASATAMAEAFASGEGEHLRAFVRFLQADADLLAALRNRKWAAFARIYNGPSYADNLYDAKLSRAYARHAAASGLVPA